MDLQTIILAVCGFALVTLWGTNLWELRMLRKDNKDLTAAISALSSTIVALQVELAHKVPKEECAELRQKACVNNWRQK